MDKIQCDWTACRPRPLPSARRPSRRILSHACCPSSSPSSSPSAHPAPPAPPPLSHHFRPFRDAARRGRQGSAAALSSTAFHTRNQACRERGSHRPRGGGLIRLGCNLLIDRRQEALAHRVEVMDRAGVALAVQLDEVPAHTRTAQSSAGWEQQVREPSSRMAIDEKMVACDRCGHGGAQRTAI